MRCSKCGAWVGKAEEFRYKGKLKNKVVDNIIEKLKYKLNTEYLVYREKVLLKNLIDELKEFKK